MATFPDKSSLKNEFAELHCRSNFSFLAGASHPEEIVSQAHALGYQAIAITDECSVAGIVKAHVAAKTKGIHLIVGAAFRIETDLGIPIDIVLLAPNRLAYGQLCALITQARRRKPKGEYALSLNDLRRNTDQCFALWIPSNLPIETLLALAYLIRKHVSKLWIALGIFLDNDDMDRATNVLALSSRLKLPVVAANDVHMHAAERKPLLDTLCAIRLKTCVNELGTNLLSNSERHLRSLEELKDLYPDEMLAESINIAQQCTFSLDELRYEYPEELIPQGMSPGEHLRQLTYVGARERWPNGIPNDIADLIEKELTLVSELRYEYYFLTVHDIVQFARSREILCQGRGSAANSAVCYCLHITEVDPSRMHLLFERFVSKERHEPPDIDVDFEHERREEVIQYIYKKYSRERAALAATLVTYRPRSAIRDVGKALGLDADLVDLLAKSMAWWDKKEELENRLQDAGINPNSPTTLKFLHLVKEILGFPRHLSQHVGGFVISAGPLAQLVTIENAAMEDRTIIQWDKDDLEALGLLKVDVLGLGMLTAIRKTLNLINNFRSTTRDIPHEDNAPLNIENIPPEDPDTYRMLQKGDSVGVFQVESRAQMAMLPRLRPSNFYDLVIEVAIVRPGPIQGNMVHPYLRRRQGIEPVTYSNDAVRQVLERTLGVPIFQEQVIELAMVAAGFSAGEADQLRRAMASWRRHGGLEQFEQKLVDGMLARGHPREFADRVFQQIRGFGEYGFPESHAASFGLLVYVSSWLKRHEPAAFYCGLLNSLPMGFYSPSQLIQDARRHNIEIRDVDVQTSDWDFQLETAVPPKEYLRPQGALRIGLRQIKGLSQEIGMRIAKEQPFKDVGDLSLRAKLSDQDMSFLARAGALNQLSGHRYQAHWDASGVDRPTEIWRIAEATSNYNTEVSLPAPTLEDDMLADYQYLGLTLGPHPMALMHDEDEFKKCTKAENLVSIRHDHFVCVSGIVTCRQRPSTATGIIFLTLEDETGNSNIVIWKTILDRYRSEVLQGQLLLIKGIVEREGEVVHVVANHIQDLSYKLGELSKTDRGLSLSSRNFH